MANIWDEVEEIKEVQNTPQQQPTNDIWSDVEEVKTQPIKQPVRQTRTYPNQPIKNMTEEEFKKNIDKIYDIPQVDMPQRGVLTNSDGEQKTLTGGIEQKVIPNWDKRGRIYYTDEQGNRIKSNVPLSRKIGNQLRATGYNIKDWLTTDVGEKAKERRKAVAMGVITAADLVLNQGRGLIGNTVGGGVGSGLYSLADQAIEGKFNPKQLAIDAGLGAGLGLGGKLLIDKAIQPITKNIARRTNIAKRRATPLADRMTKAKPQVSQEVIEQPIQQIDDVIEETVPIQQVDEVVESVPQTPDGYKRLYRGLTQEYDPKYDRTKLDNTNNYESWTDNYDLAEAYGDNVYYIDIPENSIAKDIIDENPKSMTYGDRNLLYENDKPVGIKNKSGKEYLLYTGHEEYPNIKYNKINKPQQLDEVIPEQVVEDTVKTKERGFVDTIRQNYGDEVAKQIGDKEYDVYSHEMQKANWESRTPEQKLQALNEVDNINPDVLYGKAQALNQAIQNGEPLNVAMLDGIAKNLTKAGQEIEATKHFIPTSPEGIVLETIKQTRKNTPKQVLKLKDETSQIVDEVAKTLPKQKTREQQLKAIERILSKRTAKPREQKSLATQLLALNDNNGLTPENFVRLVDKYYGIQTIDVSDYAKIQELSERFINAKTDRERDVANGLIKKFIWNKQPKKWADKDRTFRNMNMLLSLPSRLLDVTSTTAFQGINALDELVAKGVDKAMGTGLRGKMSTPAEWWKSVARGAKEGAEDVDLGINTARSGEVDRYELGFHPQFENIPILGGAEKALNATIRIPDRMFYEARFESALKDLMSTGKFTAEEAEEIARNEALQAVFQGEGLLSKSSKFARDLLNGRIDNKPMFDNETVQNIADNIQLGNRIAPFVQTPANLIAEGLERSPLGLAKGGFEMATAKTPQQLRQAQQTLAKGITGTTGATLGGGYLLNQVPNTIGGFTNEDLYGDDVTGLPPQSIVIGDKAVSLASIPFLTVPAGLGKALLEPDKTMPERLLNATTYTGNILSDLPMLKGLGDLYKGGADIAKVGADYALGNTDLAEVGQSVGRVAGQQGANILSQYIPLSGTLGTIRNAADPFNREMMTYNENPLLGTAEYIGNRLQNRIPFASSLLPMKYNVLGEPSMRNNIENPIARTLEATISPVRIRNYAERPAEMDEMQRIQDYAMENNIKGKTTLKFAKPKRYIGRGKNKINLTNEQYSELTRLYNGKVYDELQFLMNTPEYQSADEETKIKWVKEVMKEKKQEAEQEISDIIK